MLPGCPAMNRLQWRGISAWDLVEALEAGDEFFCERFAGFGPEEAAGDVAVFLDGEGEGEEHFDVLLDALDGLLVVAELGVSFVVAGVGVAVVFEAIVFEDGWIERVKDPGGVEAEVDADVAVLFEAGVVEAGAEAEDADGAGFVAPEGVELGVGGGGGGDVGGPEVPLHLELDGHVVVEVLGGFGDGVFR